jgi:hypothetical protein
MLARCRISHALDEGDALHQLLELLRQICEVGIQAGWLLHHGADHKVVHGALLVVPERLVPRLLAALRALQPSRG